MKSRYILIGALALLIGGCKDVPSAKNGKHFPADVAVGPEHPAAHPPALAAAPQTGGGVVVADSGR